jgi:hypothetical protein
MIARSLLRQTEAACSSEGCAKAVAEEKQRAFDKTLSVFGHVGMLREHYDSSSE